MSYIQQAFELVCKERKEAGLWYVCLFERAQYYGGPEEGGWWGHDNILLSYQEFNDEELAKQVAAKVEETAKELAAIARRNHGEHCLRQMEWLDARGLDADFLPEDDGPSDYYVRVCESFPESSYGPRHYE